jgi:RNA polymerase sigma-70 factor (ECF subfamily)
MVMYVYERSQRQLRAVAARYAGDEAEDVVQEAFLNALRYGRAFRGDATALTWIHRIVVNAALDHCRRRSRWDHARAQFPVRTTTTDMRSDDARAIRAALRQLSPEHRRVFVLYDLLGHTHREIARRLGIPLGTSKSRLSEARRRMRAALWGGNLH